MATPYYECTRGPRVQRFLNRDLEEAGTATILAAILPEKVQLAYSDPPWNPGNASYWRNHAGKGPCRSYAQFLYAWCGAMAECMARGATDAFTEQSANVDHCRMCLDATARTPNWTLPLLEQWTVFYGSPGSASVRRPNVLLHFGSEPIATDPGGMAGEPMTIRACAGVAGRMPPGSCVVDPCVGKGMTSRIAHYFDWDCVGVELNPARLEATLAWLRKQGYEVREATATRSIAIGNGEAVKHG